LLLLRREGGDGRAIRPLLVVIGLLGLQGAIGGIQWALELPAGIVWIHIVLATITWIAMLWTVATAGRLAPREATSPAPGSPQGAGA
jgi:cytochrome c oxidase assembly protein subunit 15